MKSLFLTLDGTNSLNMIKMWICYRLEKGLSPKRLFNNAILEEFSFSRMLVFCHCNLGAISTFKKSMECVNRYKAFCFGDVISLY